MLEKFFCRYLGHKYMTVRPNVVAMYYACRRCGKIRNQREYDACEYEAILWTKIMNRTGESLHDVQYNHVYREEVTTAVHLFLSSDGEPT